MRKKFVIFLTLILIVNTIFPCSFAFAEQVSKVHLPKANMSIASEPTTSVRPGTSSITVGSDVFLGGKYIEVGVSESGSFGTANEAPEGFHGTSAGANRLGFVVDNDGFDMGQQPTTGDFFLPGDPEEGFTVGYKTYSSEGPEFFARTIALTEGEGDPDGGDEEGFTHNNFTNAERMGNIEIPSTTTDISSGDTLAAKTEGVTEDGKLNVRQTVSFGSNDKFFKNTVILTNVTTAEQVYDVRYMRSFDPDQDVQFSNEFDTLNKVLENPPADVER